MTVLFSILVAAGLGFVICRGGICTVVAADEMLAGKGAGRFLSLFECGLWVLAVFLAVHLLAGRPLALVGGAGLGAGVIAGGMLFGLGAVVNRGCAFGTVKSIGAGRVELLGMLPGFLGGAALTRAAGFESLPAGGQSILFTVGLAPVIGLVAAFALWRLVLALRRIVRGEAVAILRRNAWPPALAMAVVGIGNAAILLLFGPWAYTTLLGDLATGEGGALGGRALLFAALMGGAMLGGVSAHRFKLERPTLIGTAMSVLGGAMMGAGATLIPGGNDSLVLTGLPLLWPYALVAYAAMAATILAALFMVRRLGLMAPPG